MKKIFTFLILILTGFVSYGQLTCSSGGNPCSGGVFVDVCTAPCPPGQVGIINITYLCDGVGGIIDTDIDNQCVLPVELVRFDVKSTDEGVTLQWETASEINNERFDILRSYDGVRFEVIDEIEGAGTYTDVSFYEFTDKGASLNASTNEVFYRLQQVDFDGAVTLSDVVSTKLEGAGSFNIRKAFSTQNDNVTIHFEVGNEGLIIGNLYDINGRLIATQENMVEKGFSSLVFSAETQTGQMYILTLNNGRELISKKFIF